MTYDVVQVTWRKAGTKNWWEEGGHVYLLPGIWVQDKQFTARWKQPEYTMTTALSENRHIYLEIDTEMLLRNAPAEYQRLAKWIDPEQVNQYPLIPYIVPLTDAQIPDLQETLKRHRNELAAKWVLCPPDMRWKAWDHWTPAVPVEGDFHRYMGARVPIDTDIIGFGALPCGPATSGGNYQVVRVPNRHNIIEWNQQRLAAVGEAVCPEIYSSYDEMFEHLERLDLDGL